LEHLQADNEIADWSADKPYTVSLRKRCRETAKKYLNATVAWYLLNFTQFVADNVDHSNATLDGKGTFHGMGIIAISTSAISAK